MPGYDLNTEIPSSFPSPAPTYSRIQPKKSPTILKCADQKCPYTTTDKKSHTLHMQSHPMINKKHTCDHCSFSSDAQGNVTKHMDLHTFLKTGKVDTYNQQH